LVKSNKNANKRGEQKAKPTIRTEKSQTLFAVLPFLWHKKYQIKNIKKSFP